MKILLMLILSCQVYALTPQESYLKYKKGLEKIRIERLEQRKKDTEKVITLIEKGLEARASFTICSYEYNPIVDSTLLDSIDAHQVREYFRKLGYRVTDLGRTSDANILNALFEGCKQ